MSSPPLAPAVALARERLAHTTGARLGATAAAIVVVVSLGARVASRLVDASLSSSAESLLTASRWSTWVVALPVALAAARLAAASDRRDAVTVMAATHGFDARAIAVASALAAMTQMARHVGTVLALTAVAGLLLGASSRSLAGELRALAAVPIVAITTAVTLGALAGLCARVGRRRARALFLVLFVGPAIGSGVIGRDWASIPGAIDAVSSLAFGTRGAP